MRCIASALVVSLLGMLLAVPASAQDVPFLGVVTQNDTKVRAGAGRAYYVVGELDQGAVVQVDEVIFGWNKIVPPEGFYSYVAEGFVEVKGDGRTGTITQDRSEVKAGSVKGPGDSYRGQVVLNRGDTVQIIEREGSGYYKIAPPKGAYVYLPPGSVNRATPEQIAAAQQPGDAEAAAPAPTPSAPPAAAAEPQPQAQTQAQAPAPAPAGPAEAATDADAVVSTAPEGSPTTPAPAPAETAAPTTLQTNETTAVTAQAPSESAAPAAQTPAETPTTTLAGGDNAAQADATADAEAQEALMTKASNYRSAAVSGKLKALEEQMIPLFFQPLEQQPIEEMITAYEAVQREPLPAVDRQIVAMRLAALRRNRDIAQTLSKIQTATSTSTDVSIPEPQPGAPLRYDAVGTLLASSVYNGTSLPRMFRIVDPATGRTIVWIEPGEPVDAKRFLGKVVGVVGDQSYDPALKFNVLDVRRIDILEAQSAVTTQ